MLYQCRPTRGPQAACDPQVDSPWATKVKEDSNVLVAQLAL